MARHGWGEVNRTSARVLNTAVETEINFRSISFIPRPFSAIPPFIGRAPYNITDLERELFALPTKFGGLGVPNPSKTASHQFNCSQRSTAPLTALILQRDRSYPTSVAMELNNITVKVKAQQKQEPAEEASRLCERLSIQM